MAALKDHVDAALGRRLAAELVAAWRAFPRRRFTSGLADAFEPLELLARFGELADRLYRTLPARYGVDDPESGLYRALRLASRGASA